MILHYFNNKTKEGIEFSPKNKSNLVFQLSTLALDSEFELILYFEGYTCGFFHNHYGLRGYLFEFKEDKELQKEFQITDSTDIKELAIEFYNAEDVEQIRSILETRKQRFKEEEHQKYLKWKEGYDKEKKKPNYSKISALIATISILVVIYVIATNLISQYYKYTGDSVTIKPGRIIHSHISTSNLGTYQFLRVQYVVDRQEYVIAEREYAQSNFRKTGDIVLVEVDTLNPLVSRIK